jgi:hypothetical protein
LGRGKTIFAGDKQNVKPRGEFELFAHHDNEP